MSEEIATAAADLETVRQLRAALDVAMQENDGLHAALATAVQREREAGADMVAIVNAAAAYLAAMTWSPASDPKWKPGDGIIDYRTPEQRLQKLLKGPGRPGAALLAELEAARAVVAATRRYQQRPYGIENGTLRAAVDAAIGHYEDTVKAKG